jgi:rare lipoprotein A (peptidoglycan hydrolase)
MKKIVCALGLLLGVVAMNPAPANAWNVREAMNHCVGHSNCGLGGSCPAGSSVGFVTIYGNGDGVHRGSKTSTGDGFNPDAMAAASKHFGPGGRGEVGVFTPSNGVTLGLAVNDYGPREAALDVTPAAAAKLGMGGHSKYLCLSYGGARLASAERTKRGKKIYSTASTAGMTANAMPIVDIAAQPPYQNSTP